MNFQKYFCTYILSVPSRRGGLGPLSRGAATKNLCVGISRKSLLLEGVIPSEHSERGNSNIRYDIRFFNLSVCCASTSLSYCLLGLPRACGLAMTFR